MKKYLITGLLIWVPLVITVWVLSVLVGTLDQTLLLLPDDWQPQALITLGYPAEHKDKTREPIEVKTLWR